MANHASHSSGDGPLGILMLNMGGPATLADVGPFLEALFGDHELLGIRMPRLLGRLIAKTRTPAVRRYYEAIGGGSPILDWTRRQGKGLEERLDERGFLDVRTYIAFRYTPPSTRDALLAMKRDGVRRVVVFPQYPQYSCTTTGSSINELWRCARELGLERAFSWSLIDRWSTHPSYIWSLAAQVERGLSRFDEASRRDAVVLFSAHSLPVAIIDRGDPYPSQVAATMHETMKLIGEEQRHVLAFQSAVGPVRWLGPQTENVLTMLGAQGVRNVLAVPLSFTCDHIETLYELDILYAEHARAKGVDNFERSPSLNDSPRFLDALADIVEEHLNAAALCSPQYRHRCPGCPHETCRSLPAPQEARRCSPHRELPSLEVASQV